MSNGKLALAVNPMSGRDVRRLAARATNMTHEAKRDIVARVAAGADAAGVTDIYITKEPFQISSMALQHMGLKANVHVVEHPLENGAADTERSMAMFLEAGCSTVVSLGGDGTNRAIVRAAPDIDLVPLSTGTNNVFPVLAEPTVAGIVAGLNARGRLTGPDLKRRVKVLHIDGEGVEDVGLIDAVLLRDDHVGNLLPFDAEKIERMVLTRAEPNSIGMSPIGGYLHPVYAHDDFGLLVDMHPDQQLERELGDGVDGQKFLAPLSPGLFRSVNVRETHQLALGEEVVFSGPGVLALDGDRDIKIRSGASLRVRVDRDGPQVIDIEAAMRWAVSQGIMAPT